MLIDESRNAASYSNGPSVGRRTPTEIVIHHWGADGQTHDGVVNFFCTTAPTSAHFVVSAGRIHCLVNLTDVAWHAGDWDVNLRSIGIECRPEATNADYAAVAWLVQYLRGLYGNLPLTPHKKYAQTACPGRYDLARINKEASGAPSPTPATKPQSATITPITEEGFLMALSDADQIEVRDNLRKLVGMTADVQGKVSDIGTASGNKSLRQFVADGTRAAQTAAAQTANIRRGGQGISLRQEVADIKTSVTKSEPVIVAIAEAVVTAPDVDGA